jgi:hypothetical protein
LPERSTHVSCVSGMRCVANASTPVSDAENATRAPASHSPRPTTAAGSPVTR